MMLQPQRPLREDEQLALLLVVLALLWSVWP
jgi:hypothetical protein